MLDPTNTEEMRIKALLEAWRTRSAAIRWC
jgi:hypothetical protein